MYQQRAEALALDKAQALGVRVIDEAGLLDLLAASS